MEGKIVKIISNLYTVKIGNSCIDCRARGKFRLERITPMVGDKCLVDVENHYILEILPRKNFLTRPMISNVDACLIVTSLRLPNVSWNLLDKMISIVTLNNIEPILCFSKMDLLNLEEQEKMKNYFAYYEKIGYKVVLNTEIDKLKKILKNKMVVITGQTGAGKSTLLNKLNEDLNLKTDEISLALGRGKHTTRHVELFPFDGFYIADTPGFSSLEINEFSKEEIRDSFIEFRTFPCPFKDCMHDKEQICSIKSAVQEGKILESRYQSYLDFIKNK